MEDNVLIPVTKPFDNLYWGIRAAVLGASGFLGRWVAAKLVEQGAKVYLIVRNPQAADEVCRKYDIQGEIVQQDLSESEAVYDLFHKIRPSVTFNLAGYGVDQSEQDEKVAFQINADMVMALCEAIAGSRNPRWHGQDFVHAGSGLEYGTIGGNLDEGSIPNPTTLYGRSKLAGTDFLSRCSRAYGIKGLTARLFTVYGPGEHPGRLLPSLIKAARTGKPLALTAGEQKRDFGYVEDVAEGLLRLGLAAANPGEVVNLATGQLLSVRRFAETAANILGMPYDRLKFGALPTRAEEMQHDEVTVERLKRLTRWTPTTAVVDGIRKTLSLEKENGNGQDRKRRNFEINAAHNLRTT